MKVPLLLALIGAGLGGALPAKAAFTGPLAPSTWSTTITGPTFGSAIDVSGAPNAITLIGGDDVSGAGCPDGSAPGFVSACQLSFVHAGAFDGTFHWSYTTADVSPQYDSFGLLIDGVRQELVANGGNLLQGGDASFHATTSFGWYLNCSDCTGGAARATVSAFAATVAAVPEPASVALLSAGLIALALRRATKKEIRR